MLCCWLKILIPSNTVTWMSAAGSIYASRGTFCARTIKETGTYDLRSLNQNKRPLDAFLAETRLLIQGSGYPPDFHDELICDTSAFGTDSEEVRRNTTPAHLPCNCSPHTWKAVCSSATYQVRYQTFYPSNSGSRRVPFWGSCFSPYTSMTCAITCRIWSWCLYWRNYDVEKW